MKKLLIATLLILAMAGCNYRAMGRALGPPGYPYPIRTKARCEYRYIEIGNTTMYCYVCPDSVSDCS